jgi:hypothetical protein
MTISDSDRSHRGKYPFSCECYKLWGCPNCRVGRAFRWNLLGMPIIPVAGQAMLGHFGRELAPRTPLRNIKTDALRNAEQIEFYSRQHPNALYAILMENGVVNIDVEGGLDKNGKDGWHSVFEMGLTVSSPYELPSISGGHHVYFRTRPGTNVSTATPLYLADGREVPGVDRIANQFSMSILWSNIVPESLDELPLLPEELSHSRPKMDEFPFAGDYRDWWDAIPFGEPDSSVMGVVFSIPNSDFNRARMLSLQAQLVRLGANQNTGVHQALWQLHDAWLRPPWNQPKYEAHWRDGFIGAVRKFGGQPPN